jgi:uncharacterized protein YdeI (YjbR/CyaY-like superfamily)
VKITESFYAPSRKEWRAWLKKHHKIKKEIWLIYYKKDSGKSRVPYNDAVEEALCFGWIDSTIKTVDKESFAQRFSPRNPKSFWSEPNLERVRFLTKQGLMTKAGLDILDQSHHKHRLKKKPVTVAADIKKALMAAKPAWTNYQKFPEGYRRIRIGWIDAVRYRPEVFKQRLDYFVKMTQKNKRYGMMEKKK